MRDRLIIYCGLLIFLGLFTFPVWRGLAARTATNNPSPVLPVRQKECVAPVEFMKTSHMTLLLQWREDVVRNGNRRFVAYNGKTYEKNLTQTCLGACHGDKAQFCDRCHSYAAVSPPCWNCHLDTKPRLLGRLQ